MSNTYDIGDLPALTATFTPDAINPSAVVSAMTVKVKDPAAVTVTYADIDGEVTEVSDNVWRFTFPAPFDQSGLWHVKFFATAGLIAAEELTVRVKAPRVT